MKTPRQPDSATPEAPELAPIVRYEFLVPGQVHESVLALFPDLRSTAGAAGGTVLFGGVEDAAHLHGILDRLQTLGLPVLEMRQLPD